MRHADVAMYRAKGQHGGIMLYSAAYENDNPSRLLLVSELRRALATDQLVMQYQPKVDLATCRVVAVEALVRWQHPDRGLVYPDTFVPLAEQTGLSPDLTRAVLRLVLADLPVLRTAMPGLRGRRESVGA